MDKMLYHHICGLPLELCDCPDQQKHIKNISFHKEPKLEPEFRPQGIVKDLKKIQLNGGYCDSDGLSFSFPPDWDEQTKYDSVLSNGLKHLDNLQQPLISTRIVNEAWSRRNTEPEPKKNHSLLIPITVMALFIACLIGGLV